jgi:hypothetical protein
MHDDESAFEREELINVTTNIIKLWIISFKLETK